MNNIEHSLIQLESELNDDTQGVTIEDIGPEDEESDCKDTQSNEQDDGSWILNLIDLSGIKDWPEKLQQDAKRHAEKKCTGILQR